MLSLPGTMKIHLAVEPVDMRKQFDGLWAVAQEKLRVDSSKGALFVFVNKRRNRLKMLYFDGTGPRLCDVRRKKKTGDLTNSWFRR